MIPVSAAFLAEVQKPHTFISYVDVVSTTGETFRLNTNSGSVTIDRTAQIRRYGTMNCVDPTGTLTPQNVQSILTPYGTVVKPYRGVIYTSGPLAGSTEVVALGTLRLSSVSVSDSVSGGSPTITISAYDNSRKIQRDSFTDVYTIAKGYSIIQAIKDLVNRSVDDVTFDVFSSTLTASAAIVFDANSDPWAACQQLASSAGCEVYFRADGSCKIAPPISIDHLPAPVYTYVEGEDNTMTDISRVFDDSSPGFNGVVLVGQSVGDGSTAPVRSVQWDTNPNSPTYYKGPYGQAPTFVTDNVVTTQADADTAAIAQLNLFLGFLDQVGLTATVNPALEPDDVILVQRARVGVNADYVISSITIPLDNGTSPLVLRQRRIT